jgi:hypothetical protein
MKKCNKEGRKVNKTKLKDIKTKIMRNETLGRIKTFTTFEKNDNPKETKGEPQNKTDKNRHKENDKEYSRGY